jgi:hypothetical protein
VCYMSRSLRKKASLYRAMRLSTKIEKTRNVCASVRIGNETMITMICSFYDTEGSEEYISPSLAASFILFISDITDACGFGIMEIHDKCSFLSLLPKVFMEYFLFLPFSCRPKS